MTHEESAILSSSLNSETFISEEDKHLYQEYATLSSFLSSETFITEGDKDLSKYEYPFENLVFEGGGTKGIAYAGIVKVLEKVGILKNIKRFAGTSAGAMIACLLAIDRNPDKVLEVMENNLKNVAIDHTCGIFSFIPKLITKYGWNSGKKLYKWFGQLLEEETGNKDITFKQLYDRYGKTELCIVVCNVSQMTEEYCHVKTTPDMPIRLAVRMSMSVPLFYEAVRSTFGHHEHFHVDGGVLVNYPVFCYDGWWLSMEDGDSFLSRIPQQSETYSMWNKTDRFKGYNDKTLGAMLCSQDDPDIYEYFPKKPSPNKPDTKLKRKREDKIKQWKEQAEKHTKEYKAMCKFCSALNNYNLSNKRISEKELTEALNHYPQFTKEDAETLFDTSDTKDIFRIFDKDRDGKIDTAADLTTFIGEHGLYNLLVGYDRRDINNLTQFLKAFVDTTSLNLKHLYIQREDIANRTVAIDVDYLSTLDFDMEKADKEFAIRQGADAMTLYLKKYVERNIDKLKLNSKLAK